MIRIEFPMMFSSLPFLLTPEGWFPPVPPDLQSESHKNKSKSKQIVVIDDEANIADSLAEILNGCGYEAHAFYDARAAIDFVGRECPAIVIADIVMPKLNGVDAAIIIRQLCPLTRILLFSGQAGTVDILKEARAKGHDFELLPKPIHPAQLLKKLSSL